MPLKELYHKPQALPGQILPRDTLFWANKNVLLKVFVGTEEKEVPYQLKFKNEKDKTMLDITLIVA